MGLPSSGVHSNGFSLIRKILFKDHNVKIDTYIDELGQTIGEALLPPTNIYVKEIKDLIVPSQIKGLCHVTGGGFYENIPRMLPEGLTATIQSEAIAKLPIFDYLMNLGKISKAAMFATFNMGIGLVAALPETEVDALIQALKAKGSVPVVLGQVYEGKELVIS